MEVPKIAPTNVAIASANKACLMRGSFSSLSSMSAFVATPTKVPIVSNISTKRKANKMAMKLLMLTPEKSALNTCPKVRENLEKSVMARDGYKE